MARWGQGDPRWIVEDRPDSVNVNNWHWREKSADKWSLQFFNANLIGLSFKNSEMDGSFTEISKCEGDATVSNRKGKIIYIFDWDIELKFKVQKGWDGEGKIRFYNISHDTEKFDYEFMTDNLPENVRKFLSEEGLDVVQQKMHEYIQKLREYAVDVVLPTKDSVAVDSPCGKVKQTECKEAVVKPTKEKLPSVTKFQTISLDDEFKCTKEDLFAAFTNAEIVRAWTRGNCQKYDTTEGGEFVLYDSNISGYFVKLCPFDSITMKWRFSSWPEGFLSLVEISFVELEDSTKLALIQDDVPEYFVENTREGWKRSYFEPIKYVLGYGCSIY